MIFICTAYITNYFDDVKISDKIRRNRDFLHTVVYEEILKSSILSLGLLLVETVSANRNPLIPEYY
jgi:hypothetical protein